MSIIVSLDIRDATIEEITQKAENYSNGWKKSIDFDGLNRTVTIQVEPQFVMDYGLDAQYVLTPYMMKRGFERVITNESHLPASSADSITNAAREDENRHMDNQDSDYVIQVAAFGERKFG